jgi:hypothetical protein
MNENKSWEEKTEEWEEQRLRRLAEQKLLSDKFKEVATANDYEWDIDPDGALRFKNWSDALAFQDLAKEMGLEVVVIEPDIQDIKNKVWLANYFKVYPKRIINE